MATPLAATPLAARPLPARSLPEGPLPASRLPERPLPPATAATALLGKVLVGVGVLYGAVLYALPLEGPEWPRLVLGGAVAAWGALGWRRALDGHGDAPVLVAAGLAATAWSYYLIVPRLGTQVTGAALLLPILACLPILGPRGVAAVGLGSIAVDMVARAAYAAGPQEPPTLTASLVVATALGSVVAVLLRRYVHDVAAARAHEHELALLARFEEERAQFLQRFINNVGHEISTPLTPLVLELTPGHVPSEAGLGRMRRNAERLRHVAAGMSRVAALEQASIGDLVRVDLRPLVDAVAPPAWDVRGQGTAWTHPQLVTALLEELVDNQQRHAPAAHVRVAVDDDRLRIEQEPAGVPQGVLGQPFVRHHETSRGGLGLYTLSRRLERTGARLEVHAQDALVHDVSFARRAPGADGASDT